MTVGPRVALALALVASWGCSTPEKREARFLAYGDRYYEKKDFARAALEYRNAIQVRPAHAEGYYKLALATLESGDSVSAVGLLEKALDRDSSHTGARLKLAELMTFSADGDALLEANNRLQQIVSASPGNEDGVNLLAVTEWRLGKLEDAEKRLRGLIERSPSYVKAALTLASMKISGRNFAEAEAILKTAASQSSNSPAPLLALGRLYVLEKRLAAAAAQFEAARRRAPNDGEALLDLARTQLALGQKERAEASFRELSRLPDYQLYHPVFLFQNGSQARAIEVLKAAVKDDPKDRDARTALVSAYLSLNRVADAEAILGGALERNPKDVEARLQHAQILIAAERYGEAESDLAVVLKYQPDMGEAHYLLAKAQGGRRARLHERQELDTALKFNPRLLAARVELARELVAAGSPQAALDLMDRAPADQAASLPAIVHRNWALVALENYSEAAKGVAMGFSVAGRVPELLLQDATVKLVTGRYDAARASLEEGLEKSPEDIRMLEALARSYTLERNGRAALDRVRRHAERHPGSAVVQKTLGDWLLRAGDKPGAHTAYRAAVSADPTNAPAVLALAALEAGEGNLDAARKRLAGLAGAKRRNAAALFELGNLDERAGDRATAMLHYRRVLEVEPGHPGALNNLAWLLAEFAGSLDEALKYAEAAGEADPDDPAIQDTLGWVYYRKGLYANAVRYLERAAARGNRAAVQYRLGMAYAKVGDIARAEKALQAGLRVSPATPEAAEAVELIQRVKAEARK